MTAGQFLIRRADAGDVEAIAEAHRDSIQSIGRGFYDPVALAAWQAGIGGDLYRNAMENGEVFFIATGQVDGRPVVLGFASDYSIEGTVHGTSYT